ncbi:hypothetical protein ACHHYP_15159 [Achlya hypogyna]|uniref:Uncharacterized protein n=1 Tax=Achlya hypogyna TaxID=1202772 RepID=A0A1V9YBJ2_ACHHY|nr:hypothetical protein ACHHYP_15159 [Achlya hypogyna]
MARINVAQMTMYVRNLSFFVAITSVLLRVAKHLFPITTHETAALLSAAQPVVVHEVLTSEVFDLPLNVAAPNVLVHRGTSMVRTQSFRRAYACTPPVAQLPAAPRTRTQRSLRYAARICRNALESCVTTLVTIVLTGAALCAYQTLRGGEPEVDFVTFVQQQLHRLIR